MLEVNHLSVYVQQGTSEKLVVDDISFLVPKGKVVGIVGESGSGKSMICSTILQLFDDGRRVSGEIRFKGEQLLTKSKKDLRSVRGKEIAFIMQNPMSMFNPMLTTGEHFVETLQAHSAISRKEAKIKGIEQLARYKLPGDRVWNKYPHELSGGMLQRIMIAIAVCHQPSLLIADEPTTALDTVTQLLILDELQAYQHNSGASMLVVSHDLGVISRLADELIVMRHGMMVEYGPASSVLADPRHPYTQALLAVKEKNRSLDELVDSCEGTITEPLVEWKPGYWVRQ
ncbi:ABC transporter ATP-binding protein [Paenibacillus sambharensis]|uniref:ABC transporter ATP-binding protein n=1 Tax=Paenibacillus sambharensis TaxID=1803190 RepID=A0A2W1LQH1_9BACL|nr:ABC transporter ATP-binding protein [Paenibacillus sambharensis]PZD97192.1 ABC transporter ATP-binding protein [Paenibacillus sambharensis]